VSEHEQAVYTSDLVVRRSTARAGDHAKPAEQPESTETLDLPHQRWLQ
jgi:hypothetical protein